MKEGEGKKVWMGERWESYRFDNGGLVDLDEFVERRRRWVQVDTLARRSREVAAAIRHGWTHGITASSKAFGCGSASQGEVVRALTECARVLGRLSEEGRPDDA